MWDRYRAPTFERYTSEDSMNWYAFDSGKTIGHKGSEDGVILKDEEHPIGARLTLERDCNHAPYGITCGIYGSMFHTTYASGGEEAESKYDDMRLELSELLLTNDKDEYLLKLERFVDKF